MAAIVWSDVTAMAPELSGVAATSQTDILAWVNQALSLSLFDGESGVTTRLARIYLAAHFATMAKLGAGGPLVSESAGGLSRSYAPLPTRSKLGMTSYGSAYLRLIPPGARGPLVT